MNRASVLAMVAAIALTAGLVLVFGNAGHDRPHRTVPVADAVQPEFGVRQDPGPAVDTQRTQVATTEEFPEDFLEILGASTAISTTSTTASPTTTIPGTTSTTRKSAPSTTAPRSTTTTTTKPTTTTTAESGVFRPDLEGQFVSLINSLRASNGLPPLTVHSSLTTRARNWSKRMAENGKLGHSDLSGLLGEWTGAGENVGRGGSVQGLFDALADSPGHRANMLAQFTHIGVGVWQAADGTLWTTHVFVR